jgi:hypothetical protein
MDQRIEAFLADVLALAGEDLDAIREGVRVALADCEAIFRAQEPNERMRDKAAHARALWRHRSPQRSLGVAVTQLCARRTGLPSGIMSRRCGRIDILPTLAIAQHPLLTTDKSAFLLLNKTAPAAYLRPPPRTAPRPRAGPRVRRV